MSYADYCERYCLITKYQDKYSMTNRELADESGLSQSRVRSIKRGSFASWDEANDIADAFGSAWHFLFIDLGNGELEPRLKRKRARF